MGFLSECFTIVRRARFQLLLHFGDRQVLGRVAPKRHQTAAGPAARSMAIVEILS
jgi:hypothetical protein